MFFVRATILHVTQFHHLRHFPFAAIHLLAAPRSMCHSIHCGWLTLHSRFWNSFRVCVCVNCIHDTFVAQTTVQPSTLNDIREKEKERKSKCCDKFWFLHAIASATGKPYEQVCTTTTLSTVLHDAYIAFGLHAGNPDT